MVRPADPDRRRNAVGGVADRRGAAARRASGPGPARRPVRRRRLRRRCRRRRRSWSSCRARAGTGWPSPRRGARPDPDRGGLRLRGLRTAGGGEGVWRRAARSSSGVRSTRRNCSLGRDRVGGRDAAYVCRGRVCDLPVTTAEELAAALGALRVACRTWPSSPEQITETVNRYLELVATGQPPMTSPPCTPRTPPSRIRSAARSTSGARRFAGSTARWPRAASSKPRWSRCARSATRRRSSGGSPSTSARAAACASRSSAS